MRIWDCELWRHKCNAARANFCICVSACLCVCLCVSVCERLYFWDKNMVLLQKKGPVGIVDTVIKQPETLTRRQGCGNNITWGWIKENLNNIICVAFVNSLPCSHSLSYIHSPMLMTLAFMQYLSLTRQISFFSVEFTWNQNQEQCWWEVLDSF